MGRFGTTTGVKTGQKLCFVEKKETRLLHLGPCPQCFFGKPQEILQNTPYPLLYARLPPIGVQNEVWLGLFGVPGG